jgi:ribosomal protein S18 acetylase RimI-like enzyme
MLERRGEIWWKKATRGSATMLVVEVKGVVAGYATLGLSRARGLPHDGEIYELYLRPEYQGLGFGRRLFSAARKDLVQSGLRTLVLWALSDNDPAVEFYRSLGGRPVARSSERFGGKTLDKVAYAWQA